MVIFLLHAILYPPSDHLLLLCNPIVTKSIVDLHGGTISVRSEGEGLGTTFTVELPVYTRWSCPSSRNSRIYHRRTIFGGGMAPLDAPPQDPLISSSPAPVPSGRIFFSSQGCEMTSGQNRSRSNSSFRNGHNSTIQATGIRSAERVNSGDLREGVSRESSNSLQGLPSVVSKSFVSPVPSLVNSGRVNLLYSPGDSQVGIRSLLSRGALPLEMIEDFSISERAQTVPQTGVQSEEEAEGDSLCFRVASPSLLVNVLAVPIRVLVADDASLNRKMMCRLLKDRCEHTAEARDGLEALTKTQNAQEDGLPYHVILLDYHMPNLNGVGTARLLRSNGYNGLIIGITGMTESQDIEDFRAAGADCVLAKPVTLEDLDPLFQGREIVFLTGYPNITVLSHTWIPSYPPMVLSSMRVFIVRLLLHSF